MNCKKCGCPMESNVARCPFCHSPMQEPSAKPFVGAPPSSAKKPNGASRRASSSATAKQQSRLGAYEYSLAWYKFLIYFLLIVSAASGFISAIIYFIDTTSRQLLGFFCIFSGIFSLVTRSELAKFKKSGPTRLIVLYVCNIAINMADFIMIRGLGGETEATTVFLTVAVNVVMIIANKIYFHKRRVLFDN